MSEFNTACAAIRVAYEALVERGLDCVTRARDGCIAALLRKAFSECLSLETEGLTYEQIRQALGFDIPLLQGPEYPELEDATALLIFDKYSGDPLFIGWIYQIWNESLREDNAWAVSYRELRQNENAQLGVVTQLFTDDYIADFLVRRSFDIQRLANPAISGLELSVCDPACGVGHILVHALRVMAHTSGSDGLRLEQPRIYGFDIDSHAVELCRALLLLEWSRLGFRGDRALFWEYLQTAISVVKAPYGSLDRSSDNPISRQKFDVVVANPPYLGRRKLSMTLRAYLDKEYPAANVDLCAAFMQRCVELTVDGGSVGSSQWTSGSVLRVIGLCDGGVDHLGDC